MELSGGARSHVPGSRSQRYEVGAQLAAGGMGVIHDAYDRLAGRQVAYKRLVIRDERLRARMVACFQREYDTIARLRHPNIVESYDYGHDEKGPYYVMELLSGADLTELAPLPYVEACRILRDVASALALVHARGLVHRDVTPANVRLTGDGRAKLMDFGALMPFGEAEELVGTPACMAPECLDDAPLDQRVDLYSLGTVAYWLLTGRMAVQAHTLQELADAWRRPLLAPSAYVPEIPKELDAFVLSLLAHDPVARPPNAAYVIERLTTLAALPPEREQRRVAYSYLFHPSLAGRAETRRRLRAAMQGSLESRGQLVLVEGAAGLGRTALLDSLALDAQIAGCAVLRARGNRSFGAFSLARTLIASASTFDLDIEATAPHARLAYDPQPRAESPADVAARHAQVIETVRGALLQLSERGPLLILVDELHESDPESIALLASLAHEVAKRPLSIVVSALSGSDYVARVQLALVASRVTLTPLNEEQVVELVEGLFGKVPNSRRLGQWLYAQSAGNPATCLDLARQLLERGVVRYTLGTFMLPHTLEANLTNEQLANAVLTRLGELGPHVERTATALSLHAGSLTPEVLAQALGLPLRELLLALEELSGRGVLARTNDGFSLLGASLHVALQQRLSRERKAELHRALASALLAHARGDVESRLQAATHLLDAGRHDAAAKLVEALGPGGFHGESAVRYVRLIEAVLAIYRRDGRSKECALALLIPLMHAGFYGALAAQQRHIDDALRWMSAVCGMTLASRLRRYLGGKLSLAFGLVYALLRRAVTPRRARLGTLEEMLGEFVGLVSAGTAAAVSAGENAAALRFNTWLEPLSALPASSSGYLLREFCIATAEVGTGELARAAQRYARLMPALREPTSGLPDNLRQTIYCGCLNGRAQAELHEPTTGALALADELSRGDAFFAPHAECARMSYYGYRGERDKVEFYRARAELLALRGGNAWSAEAMITQRLIITAILTRDAMGLVQVLASIERQLAMVPRFLRFKVFCEAWLEFLGGRPERAVELYEQFIDREDTRMYFCWRFDRACYATLLNAAGKHAHAKAVCEALLEGCSDHAGHTDLLHLAVPPLALAEAGLGQLERAAEQLDRHVCNMSEMNNALLLGDAHRDRAYVAALASDAAAFERHFAAMEGCYRSTRNPSLIQQRDGLSTLAASLGLRARAERSGFSGNDGLDGPTVLEDARGATSGRAAARGGEGG